MFRHSHGASNHLPKLADFTAWSKDGTPVLTEGPGGINISVTGGSSNQHGLYWTGLAGGATWSKVVAKIKLEADTLAGLVIRSTHDASNTGYVLAVFDAGSGVRHAGVWRWFDADWYSWEFDNRVITKSADDTYYLKVEKSAGNFILSVSLDGITWIDLNTQDQLALVLGIGPVVQNPRSMTLIDWIIS